MSPPDGLFKIAVLGTVVYVVAPHGLVALAIAVTAYDILRALIGQQILLRRLAGIDIRATWIACIPAIAGTAALLLAGLEVISLGDALTAPTWVTYAAAALTAPAAYLALLAMAFPAAIADLRTIRDRLLPRRPPKRPTHPTPPSTAPEAGYTGADPGA